MKLAMPILALQFLQMLVPAGFKKLQRGQRILFPLSDSFFSGSFVAMISLMKSLSNPRLPTEIYAFRENLSTEYFRKHSSTGSPLLSARKSVGRLKKLQGHSKKIEDF